eukprot:TRINITY_DN4527_c0_g2_i1.p1 TRINITY_DN4527_c0_g2~~TRINITY_DN4527_c0_g2_i1.p1  ORF type:complete len:154 (-),score=27.92 TRINITY_DN4527_c0_g2_i1:104-532(-)
MAQDNWRWCKDCSVLFYAGTTKGRCPGTGEPHNFEGSGNYSLVQSGGDQENWRWCKNCQVLHFEPSKGHCLITGDSDHSLEGSGNYHLTVTKGSTATTGTQSGWKWCKKCTGLWFSPAGGNRCSFGGKHVEEGSGDYVLNVS